ncbi:hypothetical protein ACIRFH_11295 [Streptomyces sp. NPDC093586]|uniref:hypothetical protein n=1 Tax=Streptomyces sp. NPDC093586 TaxID=3366042 RepID=UPI00382EF4AA
MADVYEVHLALDLPDSLPAPDLDLLRWHLGEEGGRADGDAYEHPLWAARGPAWRIGGVLIGELVARDGGWALTVRQETHPDEFDDLRRMVRWLGARTTTPGLMGHLRFHESHVPDLLTVEGGRVGGTLLRVDRTVPSANEAIPGPYA